MAGSVAWSPDGAWLAFAARRDEDAADINLVGLDGAESQLLTTTGTAEAQRSHHEARTPDLCARSG